VQQLLVRLALFDEVQAAGMLTRPQSGFHVHTAVWVPEDDRAFATRLARYGARNPVAPERPTYDRATKAVTCRSDKSEGPTAGTETVDPLEFLAPDLSPAFERDALLRARRRRGFHRVVEAKWSRAERRRARAVREAHALSSRAPARAARSAGRGRAHSRCSPATRESGRWQAWPSLEKPPIRQYALSA